MKKIYVYAVLVIAYAVACVLGLVFTPVAYILDQVYGNRYSIKSCAKSVGIQMRNTWTEMVSMAEAV